MVSRTRFNFTLSVHCLSCYSLGGVFPARYGIISTKCCSLKLIKAVAFTNITINYFFPSNANWLQNKIQVNFVSTGTSLATIRSTSRSDQWSVTVTVPTVLPYFRLMQEVAWYSFRIYLILWYVCDIKFVIKLSTFSATTLFHTARDEQRWQKTML